MAEHDLKLIISADTSDAEKKLKDIGKTQVPPVQIDVKAEKVKVDAPKVDPVKVPVSADKISIDAPKVDPVKVPVIADLVGGDPRAPLNKEPVKIPVETPVVKPKVKTPPPVKAKVVQPDPIKPTVETPVVKPTVEQPKPVTVEAKAKKVVVEVSDVEAKKKIEALTAQDGVKRIRVVTDRGEVADRKTGRERFEIEFVGNDADIRRKIAELKKDNRLNFNVTANGFGAVQQQILGIRSAISKAVTAFGTIGFVIGIAMSVYQAFKFVKDKIEETSKAVAKMRFDAEMRAAAAETNRLVSAHERLANLLKDELDTLSKQKAVGDIGKQGRRDLEDGRREAERARQIYEAKTPEEEKALRDRFEREDAEIATRRKQEDRRDRIKTLDDEESAFTAKANGLKGKQNQIDKRIEEEELNVKRARGGRKDGEEMGEAEKEARARVESLKKAKEANELAIATYEKEAQFRRDQIAALKGIQDADGAETAAFRQKQREKEKARENDKTTTEADAKWNERKTREKEKKSVDEAVEAQTFSGNKKAILDASAETSRLQAEEYRRQYQEEMAKDPSVRDASRLSDLRGKIDAADADAEGYEKRSKDITREENAKRAGELESFADRIDAADGVSQNRLTAMGLGSGVSAKGDVSSDVRKLVDLLKQNVDATKNIKMEASNGDAVFGE